MSNIYAIITILIALTDQLIKQGIRSWPQGSVLLRWEQILEIVPCTNTGAAFSMFSGNAVLLAVFSLLLIAVIGFIVKTLHLTSAAKAAFSCLLGGGLGNLADRILYGGVTDYIRLLFIRFPVFNLADIAITMAAAALFVLLLMNKLETHTGEGNGKQ